MGKVKDGAPASKAAKPSKGGPAGGSRRRFVQFLANLLRADLYKPMQGRHARIYTAVGLGVVVALGLWRLYETPERLRRWRPGSASRRRWAWCSAG